MLPTTVSDFLTRPPAYEAGPALKLYVAAPAAVVLFIASQLAAALLFFGFGGAPTDLVPAAAGGIGAAPSTITTGQLVVVLISQILTVALTWAAAAASPGGWRSALRLGPPAGGSGDYLAAVALMIPFIAAINLLAYLVKPDDFLTDFKIFLDTVRGSWPLVAATAIGLGAPLSEELLFRGFLLGSAVATKIPFWPAALAVNVAWTALHIQYSWVGILEVFAIGVFLAWTLWKTGSLRVPLVCHAVYNSSLFLIMRYLPIA